MGDTFTVRIEKLDRDTVVLGLLPGTSGGYEDCYTSRSFALILLHDALSEAAFDMRDRRDGNELRARSERSPIVEALRPEGKEWRTSAEWMKAHVGRFILGTEVIARTNELGETRLREVETGITERMGGELFTAREREWQPMRWAEMFHYSLRVVVTDPKWIAGLEEGLEFGTGAYEVWKER